MLFFSSSVFSIEDVVIQWSIPNWSFAVGSDFDKRALVQEDEMIFKIFFHHFAFVLGQFKSQFDLVSEKILYS